MTVSVFFLLSQTSKIRAKKYPCKKVLHCTLKRVGESEFAIRDHYFFKSRTRLTERGAEIVLFWSWQDFCLVPVG